MVATSQAIDVARAAKLVGLDDKETLKRAVAAVLVKRASERRRFDRLFDAFFESRGHGGDLFARLAARGFSLEELAALRELLERAAASTGDFATPLGALLERGAELDRVLSLAGIARTLAAMQGPMQRGFFTHRVLDEVGLPRARSALAALADRLRDALGERGDELARALRAELDEATNEVARHVDAVLARREEDERAASASAGVRGLAFTSIPVGELAEVRRAVRAFADRLRGGEQVRVRRAKRGRIDPHKTMRRALATGGVPFAPARRRRRRDKPRLVLLCDVSDSVRAAATFMLEFVYSAHDLFGGTRSFVFVSDLAETTALFEHEPVETALGRAYGGGVVSVRENSNYGRALSLFVERHLPEVDRRTTVVVLGDGRTNYQRDAAELLDQVRARARALVWLCPEPRETWSQGDSAMSRYAERCTRALVVRSARDLEDAARAIAALR